MGTGWWNPRDALVKFMQTVMFARDLGQAQAHDKNETLLHDFSMWLHKTKWNLVASGALTDDHGLFCVGELYRMDWWKKYCDVSFDPNDVSHISICSVGDFVRIGAYTIEALRDIGYQYLPDRHEIAKYVFKVQ